MSYLSGEGMLCGFPEYTDNAFNSAHIVYGGSALSCGIVTVDIAMDTSVRSTSKPYSFHVHGAVPFEAHPDCTGTAINTPWKTAMQDTYMGRTIIPFLDLATVLSD